ncbi:MAG TPA: hypothetical protein VIP27_11605 [Variovorax sp.]
MDMLLKAQNRVVRALTTGVSPGAVGENAVSQFIGFHRDPSP